MNGELLERLKSALAHRYAIESEVGRGGMATVYLAQDVKHDRHVAIKVLHPELAASVGAERFLREIKTVAGLNHPHVLSLHDSGEADGLLYFVMPHVEGESLRERLQREGQLPVDQALGIAAEVADGLAYAHEQGVVHRDIKPGNILLTRGHALIADFGVAKAIGVASGADTTATGLAVGTAKYMSPEQAGGGAEVDGRSDIYALGCVLWEMLAGEPPWDAPTPHGVLARKATEEPPEIRVIRKTVPPSLENVLAKAMATSPADRFQTAGELSAALEAPDTVGRVRRRGRRATRLAIGAAAITAVVATTWALVRDDSGSEPEAAALPLDSTKIAILPFQVIGADGTSPTRQLARSMGGYFELKVQEEFGRRIAVPGSVEESWRQAGGSQDSALSESAVLQLGRDLGVGALVRGTLLEADGELSFAARIVDVETGETRVPTVRVNGRREEQFDLVDRLIVLLLSQDLGWSAEGAPRLAKYEPAAVQAYLAADRAGGMRDESKRLYRRALEIDSTLVEAALWMYAEGEDWKYTPELRYAFEHRDQLTERGRAYVEVLAAMRFGTLRTFEDVINAYEALARRWPEWNVPRYELGQRYFSEGPLAGVPDWHRRAREELERIANPNTFGLLHLAEAVFAGHDTARARELATELKAHVRPGDWVTEWPAAYVWRLAILQGDSATAAREFEALPNRTPVLAWAYAEGRGIHYADRFVAADSGRSPAWTAWPVARGRFAEYRDRWLQSEPLEWKPGPAVELWHVLFQGVPPDSITGLCLDQLERIVAGQLATDPAVTEDERAMAVFWTTLWRLSHGDAQGAREAIRYLDEEAGRWGHFAVFARMLEVLVARAEGADVRPTVLRMDSLARTLPVPVRRFGWAPNPTNVENLFLARELARIGETERALAASRRRFYGGYAHFTTPITAYLREEARLAAAVGDTTGAVEAYRHYFALRDNRPDLPTWAAQWDSMRVEYAALTGVETP